MTFALRETLYSLAAIERELVAKAEQSHLVETMEKTMLEHPTNWQKYYRGSAEQQRVLRVYSYSDRIRYYWKFPEVEASVARLLLNLREIRLPDTMLSQYCPRQYDEVRAGTLKSHPKALAISNIQAVLAPYSVACRGEIGITT